MQILFGNTARKEVQDWYKQYNNVGTLISIKEKEITPPNIPFALDNGAFSYFLQNQPFDFDKFLQRLDWYLSRCTQSPDWILVPDKVGDRTATIQMWNIYAQVLNKYGIPLAFAVQDGMTIDDVPKNVHCIFVGGSTDWKVKTIPYWCKHFPRVHIARVNGFSRLCYCLEHKVASVDGTGYFRGGLWGSSCTAAQIILLYQSGLINLKWRQVKLLRPKQRESLIRKILNQPFDIYSLPLLQSLQPRKQLKY